MPKTFISLGAINALLCILLGAFGAHGLKQMLSPDMLTVFQTGVQFHFYHAIGLMIIGIVLLHFNKSKLITTSGWLMFTGIVLFCGSLYVLSMTGMRQLGMLAPFGGTAFMIAWGMLAYGVLKAK